MYGSEVEGTGLWGGGVLLRGGEELLEGVFWWKSEASEK